MLVTSLADRVTAAQIWGQPILPGQTWLAILAARGLPRLLL